MQTQINIGYQQLLNLALLLSDEEKLKFISELQKKVGNGVKREIAKYDGKIWMSEDFNEPLEEFSEYMP